MSELTELELKNALTQQQLDLYVAAHRDVHRMEGTARELAVTELKQHLESLNGNQRLMASERGEFVRKDWYEGAKRLTVLEMGNKEYIGSREPIRDMIRWVSTIGGSLIVLGLCWAAGHFFIK
jgi:hypothetical protein